MSVILQWAPYHLREGGWDELREEAGDLALKALQGQDPLHILGDGNQVRHYTYGGDLASRRYRPFDQINASNFNSLQIAWQWPAAAFGQALRLRPDDARLAYQLGVTLERQGRPEDALAPLRAAGARVFVDATQAVTAVPTDLGHVDYLACSAYKWLCCPRGLAFLYVREPESVLPEYDLVFAKARCVLEAAATGAAVIICDVRGMAGMITTSSIEAMRQLNFGVRTLQRPITPETIGEEIDRYDAADAAAVCDRIRSSAGTDLLADQYIALYEELSQETVTVSPAEDLQDVASSLTRMRRSLPTWAGSMCS